MKQDNTLFKLDRNFCPPVQVISHHRVCHHIKPDSGTTWLALPIYRSQHYHSLLLTCIKEWFY